MVEVYAFLILSFLVHVYRYVQYILEVYAVVAESAPCTACLSQSLVDVFLSAMLIFCI